MFGQLLKTNFIDDLQKKASPVIKKTRAKYDVARQTVIEFCKDNDVFLSNPKALAVEDDIDDVFEMYCENPYKYALMLTNELYKKCSKYVVLKTFSKNKQLEILFNTFTLVNIYAIVREKRANIKDLVLPIVINKINYISPELELIDIYRSLYNPAKKDDWEELLDIEEKLLPRVFDRVKILGGKCDPCKLKRTASINSLKKIVLENFVNGSEYVVLGEYGLRILSGDIKSHEKIQIVSKNRIEDDIKQLIEFIEKYTDYGITYRRQKIDIPKDFRTKKFTVYVEFPKLGKTVQKAFLDIYNSAQFELIPYVKKDGYLVGNPFVLSRFLMIDLWIIRIIHKLGLIPQTFLTQKIILLIKMLKQIKALKWKSMVFGDKYIGNFEDYFISTKIDNLTQDFSYPYYPALHASKGLREL